MIFRRFTFYFTTLMFSCTLLLGQHHKVDSLLNHFPKSDASKNTISQPKINFGGFFQGRYITNFNSENNFSGQENSFQIRFARLQLKANINDKTEVLIITNLADQNKILENASIKYQLNSKTAIQFGQFRPLFGIEQRIPVDLIHSLERSNQYIEFGKLGWTNFQIGASLIGESNVATIPFQYTFSITNGNGRNQIKDNDNDKLILTRINFNLLSNNLLDLGINGGFGKSFDQKVMALAADFSTNISIRPNIHLNIVAEGKTGTNYLLFSELESAIEKNIQDYRIRGIYILPDIRFELSQNLKYLSVLEFSCRYEILDTNYKLASNPRQTIMPMVGLEFFKYYGTRIQMGAKIDRYKNQYIAQNTSNNNLLILQLQTRF